MVPTPSLPLLLRWVSTSGSISHLESPGGIPTEHGGDVLGPLRDECCIPYLDGVLCYVKTFEEHVETILKVLQALQRHGVKLRPEKCDLFKQEIRYVGHLVSAEGVNVEPRYLEAEAVRHQEQLAK